jgi:hypothetical protein
MAKPMGVGGVDAAVGTVVSEDAPESRESEGLAAAGGLEHEEECGGDGGGPFDLEVSGEDIGDGLGEGHDAFLVALAEDAEVAEREVDIGEIEAEDLEGTEAFGPHEQGDGAVAPGAEAAEELEELPIREGLEEPLGFFDPQEPAAGAAAGVPGRVAQGPGGKRRGWVAEESEEALEHPESAVDGGRGGGRRALLELDEPEEFDGVELVRLEVGVVHPSIGTEEVEGIGAGSAGAQSANPQGVEEALDVGERVAIGTEQFPKRFGVARPGAELEGRGGAHRRVSALGSSRSW